MTSDVTQQTRRAPIFAPPEHLPAILNAPAEQLLPERFLIYSIIFGLKPARCLEIGTHWGGSASIICAAMDDNNLGKLVTVDPAPLIAPETMAQIGHRVTSVKGFSPDALGEAKQQAGGLFDFALIDGDHTYAGVLRDIEGVLPFLADHAYLLLHDSNYFEIDDAINDVLRQYPENLVDCGLLSIAAAPENRLVDGRAVVWGGLRLLRFVKTSSDFRGNPVNQGNNATVVQLQAQLHAMQAQLDEVQNTRTWRICSKLSYSFVGRFVSSLFKPFFP